MPDRPATTENEIEVTPAMIEAGLDAAWATNADIVDLAPRGALKEALPNIFRAMSRALGGDRRAVSR